MPVTVQWGNPDKTFIVEAFHGQWNVNEIHQGMDTVQQLLDEVSYPVSFVVDLTGAVGFPANLSPVAGRFDRLFKDRMNQIVMVGANTYLKTVIGVLVRLMPSTLNGIQFAASLEEAQAKLSRHVTG